MTRIALLAVFRSLQESSFTPLFRLPGPPLPALGLPGPGLTKVTESAALLVLLIFSGFVTFSDSCSFSTLGNPRNRPYSQAGMTLLDHPLDTFSGR